MVARKPTEGAMNETDIAPQNSMIFVVCAQCGVMLNVEVGFKSTLRVSPCPMCGRKKQEKYDKLKKERRR